MTLRSDQAFVLVIDIQEAFRGAVADFGRVAERAGVLVEGARVLGLPITATEQYPKGLGPTAPEVRLDGETVIPKTVFAASQAPGFELPDLPQVVVCGIEAHVCVHQTVEDLVQKGLEVHVCVDAIASRDPRDLAVARDRIPMAGAVPTTVEMALLELCRAAGTDEFRQIQALIK